MRYILEIYTSHETLLDDMQIVSLAHLQLMMVFDLRFLFSMNGHVNVWPVVNCLNLNQVTIYPAFIMNFKSNSIIQTTND